MKTDIEINMDVETDADMEINVDIKTALKGGFWKNYGGIYL